MIAIDWQDIYIAILVTLVSILGVTKMEPHDAFPQDPPANALKFKILQKKVS